MTTSSCPGVKTPHRSYILCECFPLGPLSIDDDFRLQANISSESLSMMSEGNQKSVVVVALGGIVVSSACIAFVDDWWRLLPSLLAMVAFVLIVAWAVRPRSGTTKIRIAALMLCFATIGHAAYLDRLLIQVINHIGPRLISTFTPLPVPEGIQWQLLLYDAVVIFIVFHYTRESVLPQPAPLQKNSRLRLPGFQERFDQAVQHLAAHLTALNRSLD
jgi:hypothetical protein